MAVCKTHFHELQENETISPLQILPMADYSPVIGLFWRGEGLMVLVRCG